MTPATPTTPRPLRRLRSLLFVPAQVPRFVARAAERGADAVVLDLEDSVPEAERPAARAGLPAALAALAAAGTCAVLARPNRPLLDLARDLEAAVRPGLAGLVLPKAEDAAWVREVSSAVAALETARGMEPGGVRLVLQVETPAALLALPAICAADPRVAAVTLGPEDLSAALGAEPSPELLGGPTLALVAAARAAGVVPLGLPGPIGEFSDLDAYAALVAAARRVGVRGSLCVHPAQVPVLNAGFAPGGAELAWARRALAAEAEALARGRAAWTVDGRMGDPPVARRAREIVALSGEEA